MWYGFYVRIFHKRTVRFTLLFLTILILSLTVTARTASYSNVPEVKQVVEESTPQKVRTTTKKSLYATVTAYTGSENVTASGEQTHTGGVACPTRYEFGTVVYINDVAYYCNDRMLSRYRSGDYFDIWMENKGDAVRWGKRKVLVTIIVEQ